MHQVLDPLAERNVLFGGSFLAGRGENRVVGRRCDSWACFGPIQDIFVVAELFCDVGTFS